MRVDLRCGAVALLLAAAAPAAGGEALLAAVTAALPAGARETARVTDPPADYGIAIGPAGPMAPPPERVQTGTRLRVAWSWPDADPKDVQARLSDALSAAGLTPVFTCRDDRCGGFDFRRALPVLPLPDMVVNLGAFRYRAFTRDAPPTEAALLVSAHDTGTHAQITLVQDGGVSEAPRTAPPAPDRVRQQPADDSSLGAKLAAAGRAVLAGVTFDPGETTLASGDAPVLAELAAWLAADPARRVALVGHTDWSGTPDANLALSRARAAAVAAALEEIGVNGDQVTVAGVGPFAPRAGNRDAAGRTANRRVEVVELPPAK